MITTTIVTPSADALRSVEKSGILPPRPGLRNVTHGLALTAIALLALPASAANRYVDQNNATPAWPYDNWTSAAVHIQDAVDAASDNDTVWVRAGTYTLPSNPTNYYGTNVVFIGRPLTLRSETDNPADVTIDGEGMHRPIAVAYTNTVNTSPFQATTDPFIIRGLTVTNGYGISRGGGILFYHKRRAWPASVLNCVVADNSVVWGARKEEGVFDLGDGAYGGGICSYAYSDAAQLIVSNSVIRSNQADPLNAAASGGGIYARTAGRKHVVGTRIEQNESFNSGGAHLEHGGPTTLIENSLFARNTGNATGASGGGGGGLRLGAGGALVRNSLFHDNTTANYGGGIMTSYQQATARIINCTLVYNQAPSSRGGGIGVRFAYLETGSGIQLLNSIVYHNAAYNIYYEKGTGTHAQAFSRSAFTNNITTVLQGSVPFPGTGNIIAAPTFVDAGADNYRLARDSRGVNEGFNLDAALQGATDLDGNRRIDGTFNTVDIGCYEHPYRGTSILIR